MKVRNSKNVFRDLGFKPAEARNLGIRATLMAELSEHIRTNGLTTREAAETLGVSKLKIRDLLRGRIQVLSLETLTAMHACMKVN